MLSWNDSASQVAVLGPPWSSFHSCSMNVAKPSLSQMSCQWWTDTESPNHWCANSWTMSSRLTPSGYVGRVWVSRENPGLRAVTTPPVRENG